VTWPEGALHFTIRFGPRVLVHHHHTDRRAESFPLEDTAENTAGIRLVARRHDLALAGPAAIKIALNVSLGQFD
jgi:hypothetical protein